MPARITARFDALYSPTALAADRQPPMGTRAFFGYFIRQFRGALVARLVLVGLGSVADAMLPVFVGWVVGMLSTTPPGALFTEHWRTLLFMLAVILFRPVTFAADALVRNHAITPNLVDLVRWQSHWHVIRQSWTFFQDDFAGRIGNKILQAGESIEMTVNLTIDAVWYAAVFVVVATIALAGMDLLLLIPMIVWLAAYALLFRWTMPRVDRLSEEVSDARSIMSGRMVDSYTNIQTLKTFADDGEEDAYVADAITAHVRPFRRLMATFTWSWSLLFLLNALLVASVGWIALAGWNEGRMTTAMVATAIPFVLQIMNISGWILEVGSNVFRQIGTVRDSMVTIAKPLTLVDAPDAKPLVVTRGELVYDRVGFDYWRGDAGSVVRDFSLTVRPGERIGLVGRSGAGKSTLVNLTLRMFDVASGAIRIDGQDIRAVTQQSLRKAIGVVGQDTSLLHRSVRENIKYGRPGASDAEMIEAARRASIDEVVEALVDPGGPHRLRRPRRRARGQALGRPAAAHRAGAGDPQGRADPRPRRGDERARLGGRGGDPGHALPGDAGQDGDRHRPPPVDHRPDGPHRRPRPRPDRRGRHPRRPDRPGRPLCRAVGPPVGRLPRSGRVGGSMYTPPAFRDDDRASIHAGIEAAGLATLVTMTEEGLVGTPLPFLLSPDEGPLGTLYGHVAKANPQWRLAPVGEALAIFAGPDAYISPGWYATKAEHGRVVPTWNYAAVHAYGVPEFFEDPDASPRPRRSPDRPPRGRPRRAVVGRRRARALREGAAEGDRRGPPSDLPTRRQAQVQSEPERRRPYRGRRGAPRRRCRCRRGGSATRRLRTGD